jgi:hypothetical protein
MGNDDDDRLAHWRDRLNQPDTQPDEGTLRRQITTWHAERDEVLEQLAPIHQDMRNYLAVVEARGGTLTKADDEILQRKARQAEPLELQAQSLRLRIRGAEARLYATDLGSPDVDTSGVDWQSHPSHLADEHHQ